MAKNANKKQRVKCIQHWRKNAVCNVPRVTFTRASSVTQKISRLSTKNLVFYS